VSLAINPQVTTYAAATPYLTVAEYQNAPTSVNTDNLVSGGTKAQNAAELANVIARASSWADNICRQVLAATLDIDPIARYRVNRWGTVIVPLNRKPILEIDAISVGPTPSLMAPLTSAQAADLVIGASTLEIPVASLPQLGNAYLAYGIGSRVLVQVNYVNGYPNTVSTDPATVGDSSIDVASVLGIYPGSTLQVYDDVNSGEQIQVASTYTTGDLTLPLVAPLMADHAAGVSVSALPPAVKQAVISLTSSLLKSRGSTAIVMRSATEPGGSAPTDPAGPDVARATKLLDPFRRVR